MKEIGKFLCGEVDDPEDMAIVCFGCMFEMHPFIAEFCDMPKAWIAWRDAEQAEWESEELGPDEG